MANYCLGDRCRCDHISFCSQVVWFFYMDADKKIQALPALPDCYVRHVLFDQATIDAFLDPLA